MNTGHRTVEGDQQLGRSVGHRRLEVINPFDRCHPCHHLVCESRDLFRFFSFHFHDNRNLFISEQRAQRVILLFERKFQPFDLFRCFHKTRYDFIGRQRRRLRKHDRQRCRRLSFKYLMLRCSFSDMAVHGKQAVATDGVQQIFQIMHHSIRAFETCAFRQSQ